MIIKFQLKILIFIFMIAIGNTLWASEAYPELAGFRVKAKPLQNKIIMQVWSQKICGYKSIFKISKTSTEIKAPNEYRLYIQTDLNNTEKTNFNQCYQPMTELHITRDKNILKEQVHENMSQMQLPYGKYHVFLNFHYAGEFEFSKNFILISKITL